MSNYIVSCPKCQHSFEPTDAIRDEIEKELRGKMTDWQKKKEEETNQLLAEQKAKIQNELTEQLKKNIAGEYEHKLKLMQDNEANMSKQVHEFRQKELEFLKQVQAIQAKEAELELELQRKLNSERESLKAQIQKEEAERLSIKDQEHILKVKELEKQLEDQRKLAEEMRRKAEQGSMQMQGEVRIGACSLDALRRKERDSHDQFFGDIRQLGRDHVAAPRRRRAQAVLPSLLRWLQLRAAGRRRRQNTARGWRYRRLGRKRS